MGYPVVTVSKKDTSFTISQVRITIDKAEDRGLKRLNTYICIYVMQNFAILKCKINIIVKD